MLKNATVRVRPCASLASGSVQLQTFTCRTLLTRRSSGLHFCLAATGLQVRSPRPFLCAARLFSPRVSRYSRYCFSLRLCSDLAACPGSNPTFTLRQLRQAAAAAVTLRAGEALIRIWMDACVTGRSWHRWDLDAGEAHNHCIAARGTRFDADVLGRKNRKTLSGNVFNTKASPAVDQRVVIKERKRQQTRLQQGKMRTSHREAK